jgi:hypothetical protein
MQDVMFGIPNEAWVVLMALELGQVFPSLLQRFEHFFARRWSRLGTGMVFGGQRLTGVFVVWFLFLSTTHTYSTVLDLWNAHIASQFMLSLAPFRYVSTFCRIE